jgi:hypothetical protein
MKFYTHAPSCSLTSCPPPTDPEIEEQMQKYRTLARGTGYNELFLPALAALTPEVRLISI